MKIKKIKLVNAFQHKSLEAEFENFQVIIGRNGTGKSNLIEAILVGLGYRFGLPGNKDTLVTDGEKKGSVELVVEHEGELITITHALDRTSRSLVRGDLKLGAQKEVLAYIENNLLGMSYISSLATNVIRQGKLTSGLFDPPAERFDFFSQMSGIRGIEAKRKQLSDEKEKHTTSMVALDMETAETEIAKGKEAVAKRLVELTQASAQMDTDKEKYEQSVSTAALHKKVAENAEKMKEHKESQIKNSRLMVTAEEKIKNLKSDVSEAQAIVDRYQTQVVDAKAAVAAYDANKVQWDQKVRWENEIVVAEKIMQETNALAPGEYTGSDKEKVREIVTKFESIKKGIETKLNGLRHAPEAKCNACGAECQVCAGLSGEKRAVLVAAAETEFAKICGNVDKAKAKFIETDRAVRFHRDQENAYKTSVIAAETTLKSLKENYCTVRDLTELKIPEDAPSIISAFEKAKELKVTLEDKRTKVEDIRNRIQLELAKADAAIKAIGQVGDAVSGVDEAETVIKQYDELRSKFNQLKGQQDESEKFLKQQEDKLVELKKKQEQNDKVTEFVDYLESARAVLHRSEFPSTKISAFIKKILVHTNEYLETMGSAFYVSYDHDTGFTAHFPGSRKVMRADRLSGGEQIVFCLAFRFSISSIYSESGFMILDEPTVWLDVQNVDCIINALTNIKGKLTQQVIIVTHEEKMAVVSDNIFNLNVDN